ncbi:MAG: TerB family tellurite resistance protein [Litorimonas sp.]
MHIILGILTAVGAVIFFLARLSRNAGDIADGAQTLSNLPRRLRHAKAVNRSGLDLVETPLEAATVLMIAVTRMSEDRRFSDAERRAVEDELVTQMHLHRDDADGLVRQTDILQSEITLPENTLFPMVDILRDHIDRTDAQRLAKMMDRVAQVEGPTQEQTVFIHRYRERMGLI